MLAGALKKNKTLVKLDLSNNAMKSFTSKFFCDAIKTNTHLTEINFSHNLLDDEFADQLSDVLRNNQVLYSVDISMNPIGPTGARNLLDTLYEYNDTLGNLGDLSDSYYMGVRIRQDIKQAIELNNSSHDKKKAFIEQMMANTRRKNVDQAQTSNPLKADEEKDVPLSV